MPHLLHPYKLVMGGDIAPVVQSNFALSANDFDSLSSTSTMPTGGSISRAGNAMVTDSSGKLTWAAANLIKQSGVFSDAEWSPYQASVSSGITDPFGGTAAYKLTENTANDAHAISQISKLTLTNGYVYIFSSYFKAAGRTWARVRTNYSGDTGAYFDLTNGVVGTVDAGLTASISSAGNGWYRCSIKFTSSNVATQNAISLYSASVNGTFSYTGDGSSGVYVYGAQIEAVTYQTTPSTYVATTTSAYYGPRLDYYWNGSAYVAKGYLVEGAGANLVKQSQLLSDTAWNGGSNTTVTTTSATTAPDGTTTASLVNEGTGSSVTHYVGSNGTSALFAVTSGTAYIASIFVKDVDRRYVQITFGSGTFGVNAYANFDLTNVQASAGSAATAGIVSVGNGWYRCWMRATPTGSGNEGLYFGPITSLSDGRIPSFTGTSKTFYAWGAMVEASAFVTSYLPTAATAPVNRAAETLQLAGYQSRLVEAFYIDEQTGVSSRALTQPSATSPVTISGLPWGWLTSLRAYTNAYAGDPTLPSWLSVAATGNRMVYDSTGYLTWAPHNLLTYSNTFSNAAWVTTGSTSTMSASVAADPFGGTNSWTQDNTGTSPYVYQSVGTLDDKTYTASVYLKKNTARYGYIILVIGTKRYAVLFDLQTGAFSTDKNTAPLTNRAYSITSAGNGWYRCSVTGQNTGGGAAYIVIENADTSAITVSGSLDISNATNGQSIYVYGAQFEAVTYQTAPRAYIPTTSAAVFKPRFDVDPATLAARGLLIEGAGTNLATYSQDIYAGTWGVFGGGSKQGSNVADAPDGTTTADAMRVTTAGTGSNVYLNPTLSAGTYTWSIWVKRNAATNQTFQLLLNVGGTATLSGDLTATASWQRFSVTGTGGAGSSVPGIVGNTSGAQADLLVWGAQLETGSIATSYIPVPTTGPVNRAAETPSAALYTTNPSIIQYRPIPAGTRARKVIDPFSGISSETQEWIESGAVYPMGTGSAYLNTKLTVDGPY